MFIQFSVEECEWSDNHCVNEWNGSIDEWTDTDEWIDEWADEWIG